MANVIKTLSAGDITRKALSILHNNLVFCKTINKEYDDRFARSGAKNGGTLLIREPNEFSIRTGQTMDTQDVEELTQTLTVATQMGVDVNFSSVELTLSLDDFAERILKPAMSRLAAEVDKTVIAACYPYVNNLIPGAFGTLPVLADVLSARAKLAQGLSPGTDRRLMCGSLETNSIITAGHGIYAGQPAAELSRQYSQGLVGDVYGLKFYESEMTPTHTNGTRGTDCAAAFSVNTSTTTTAIANGVATIRVSATASVSATTTWNAGDVFTIAGVYDVNPETKVTLSHLKQWSVIAQATGSAIEISVSPTPYSSGVRQNCAIVAASVTASSVVVCSTTAGSSGIPATAYLHSLVYHKDAFTMVTADLEMPRGVDFAAREVFDGISLRIVRQYDVVNDKFPCRIDVLFGQKTLRTGWACRLGS